MTAGHEGYMEAALEEARIGLAEKNLPVGSVLVIGGEIIGRGRNIVKSRHDVTAHAEVVAIREACAKIQNPDLSGGVLYTTLEPCPMCCWAILVSNIDTLVLGARLAAIGRRYGEYSVETLMELTGKKINVVTGVRTEECEKTWRQGLS